MVNKKPYYILMPFVSSTSQVNGFGRTNVLGGSIELTGTSQIRITDNVDFNMSDQLLTIEFFVYIYSLTTTPYFFDRNFSKFYIANNVARNLRFEFWSGLTFISLTFGSLPSDNTNKWFHIALTRDLSNNFRLFVDGIQRGSAISNSVTSNSTSDFLSIGNQRTPDINTSLNGCITNFKWIKGVCLYSSNFTPPKIPLVDSPLTKVLLLSSKKDDTFKNSSATSQSINFTGATWNSKTPFF